MLCGAKPYGDGLIKSFFLKKICACSFVSKRTKGKETKKAAVDTNAFLLSCYK